MRSALVLLLALAACSPSSSDYAPSSAASSGAFGSGAFGGSGGGVGLYCGDGRVGRPGATETCDDGNTTSSDGCSSACAVEAGYVCVGSPSVCRTTLPAAGANQTPTFLFYPAAGSGVANLTADTFGSTTLTTVVDCDARTDTGTSWPCATGGTFVENPSGVTTGFHTPFTDETSRASIYAGSVAHEAPDTTTGEIATEDFVARVVARLTSRGAVQQLVGKYNTGGSLGWKIGVDATNHINATVNATTIADTATIDANGEWNILALYCKHDGSAGSMRLTKNGTLVASGVCPAATSAAPTKHLTYGAQSDNAGAQSIVGHVSNVKIKKCTACMTTTAAMDAEAQKHALELEGVRPSIAVDFVPLATSTRATPAMLCNERDGDYLVYCSRVGADWYRVETRCDNTRGNVLGGCERYTGYLSEQTGAQKLVQSADFATTWTLLNGADNVQTQRYNPPDGSLDGDRMRGAVDAVGTEHGVRQTSATLTAERYTFSVVSILDTASPLVKPYMWLRDNTVANTATWFDTRACTVAGTIGTGLFANTDPPMKGTTATRRSARASYWGTNATQVECLFEIDILGTVATHDFDIGWSNADGTLTSTIAGANEVIGGMWGAQVEQTVAGHRATSRVFSGATAGTRNGDRLEFDDSNVPSSGGTLAWSVFLPNSQIGSTIESDLPFTLWKDADNNLVLKTTQSTGNGQRSESLTSTAGGGFYAEMKVASVEQFNCCGNTAGFGQYFAPAANNGYDGREHHARIVYGANYMRAYLDGSTINGIGDATVTMPADFTGWNIAVGFGPLNGLNHPDGLIRYGALYSTDSVPLER